MFVDEIKVATNKSVSAQIERECERAPHTQSIMPKKYVAKELTNFVIFLN